jgi:1-acyl-sn-glycerol-3-phosphate acyltransferase
MTAKLTSELSWFERFAVSVGRICNETAFGKRSQDAFLRIVTRGWVNPALASRMYVEGLDDLMQLQHDRGVMMVSNHRSFFDFYAILAALWIDPIPWVQQLYFPVRSNFFYEGLSGISVNLMIGGGSMYPPVYRQPERSRLNMLMVEKVVSFLQKPGVMVGMHPEGTRNKGDDPYSMLPAQPGVGMIALKAQPVVIPVFIQGLTNSLPHELRARWVPDVRRNAPCIAVFGKPMNYVDLLQETPRPTLYKKFADRSRDEILSLGERAKRIAEWCHDGKINDADPGWMANRLLLKRVDSKDHAHRASQPEQPSI